MSETTEQKDLSLQLLITEGKNPRGIPAAKFIVRSAICLIFGVSRHVIKSCVILFAGKR